MNAAPIETWVWSRRRWLLMVALVMGVQVLLIFWLSARDVASRAPFLSQGIFLRAERTGLAEGLSDPTMFVLPNRHGFSGPAWVNGQGLVQPSLEWTEPPRWLTQNVARLGMDFCVYVAENVTTGFQLSEPSEPEMISVISDFRNGLVPTQSTIRVKGDMANRRLVSRLELTAQAERDMVLSSSEVEIGVMDDGTVFSAKLAKGCGDKSVDDEAVRQARGARFARVLRTAPGTPDALSWGTLVFQWLTVAPSTNSVAARQ